MERFSLYIAGHNKFMSDTKFIDSFILKKNIKLMSLKNFILKKNINFMSKSFLGFSLYILNMNNIMSIGF